MRSSDQARSRDWKMVRFSYAPWWGGCWVRGVGVLGGGLRGEGVRVRGWVGWKQDGGWEVGGAESEWKWKGQ